MAAKSAAPQNLGCISFGGISCLQASAVGGSTPKPGPFSFYSERKGGKEAPPGFHPWTPSAQPAGAKGWAAPLTATPQMRLAALGECLIIIGRVFTHDHFTRNTPLREANAAQRRGRHSRCAVFWIVASNG